ncbi:MAG: SH3 domain-containing protein, partial [Lachnospiraceae bacterium]|nr:SH3 domain-containing protein [Lachnospiraceae bacterium]
GVGGVIVGIFGGFMLHKDGEAVETMAESTEQTAETAPPTAEENSTALPEEAPKEAELAKDEEMEEIDAYMYTTADLNMRKEGATDSEVIGSIPYGTQIHVTARTADNWYRTERGEIGFVSGKYLSDTKPEQNTSSQQASSGTAESSGDTSTASKPSGGTQSSVPGISQAQMDALNAYLAAEGQGQPYTGPNMEMAWDGGGGRSINN